jgi:hypothetical protein
MDLELATVEDMVAELERRGIALTLVTWPGLLCGVGPPLEPGENGYPRVYADSSTSEFKSETIVLLCHGIQQVLHAAFSTGADGCVVRDLSVRTEKLEQHVHDLTADECNRRNAARDRKET